MAEITNLVAAVCPDIFCQPQARAKVRKLLQQALAADDKLAYLKAAEEALPVEPNLIALDQLWEDNFFNLPGHRSPVEQHSLTVDNPAEPLEPIYFELLQELAGHEGWVIEKLVDTASTTPGSGLGLDLNQRTQLDQHEATRLLTFVRQRIRAFVQEWQTWRDHKRRLTLYVQARTPDDPAAESARHRLSHKWQEGDYVDGTDREAAFAQWLKDSEAELRAQTEIDRDLLAGDLNLLRLQVNWLRPYLQAQANGRRKNDPALAAAFNTAIFDVALLVRLNTLLPTMVDSGELPKMLLHPKHRRSEPVLVVEIQFRAIPERTKSGGYAHRGRAELRLTSYALRDDEISILRRELQRSEWGEVLGMLETDLAGNLSALLNELDELLTEPNAETKTERSPKTHDPNPFTALFDFSGWFGEPDSAVGDQKAEPLRADSDAEGVIRSLALLEARQRCLEIYDRSKQLFTLSPPSI